MPNSLFTAATSATMATRDAPMDSAICMPVTAPSATASITLVLFPLLSILTLPTSRTSSVWGRSILATIMLPTGTSVLAIRRYSMGMPRAV